MNKFISISAVLATFLLAGCSSSFDRLDVYSGPASAPVGLRADVTISTNVSNEHLQELVPTYGDQSLYGGVEQDTANDSMSIGDESIMDDSGVADRITSEDPRDRDALASDSYVSEVHDVTFPDSSCAVKQGDIVIYTSGHKLLFATGCGEGRVYPIAVGRDGMKFAGATTVERTTLWPDWYPPEEMRAREATKGHFLPIMMPGGKGNPLGARAIYLAGTQYRIHGTDKPESIGTDASSGCIRMHNADVMDLFNRVQVGAHVYVLDKDGKVPNQIVLQN